MSKKRQTVKATPQGLTKAEKALVSLHNGTQLNLASALTGSVGRSTIQKFFKGEKILVDRFREICEALQLESQWEAIAGLVDLPDPVDAPSDRPDLNTPDNILDWCFFCGNMLEPQRRTTSNPLMQDESAKKDIKQIHVPLALIERKKTDKRNKEDFSPDAGTRLYEPEYEKQQQFEYEAFLNQILERGSGKTKGKRIAVIGEPGAGKTTLLSAIAFWVLEKNWFFRT